MLFVINAGSSSVKFSVYESTDVLVLVEEGQASVRDGHVHIEAQTASGETLSYDPETLALEHDRVMLLLSAVLELLERQFSDQPKAVVHRVVHGGEIFQTPVRVDAQVRDALEVLVDLAPLHQPVNLAGIDAFSERYPDAPQIACFDTAFHAGQSKLETQYALPRDVTDAGVRKYGFHGLSYQSICQQLPAYSVQAPYRAVICHLGNGASICAVEDGRSVASTMGFTAVEGLPMGTRSGRLDPGVLLHLLSHHGYHLDELEHLLYQESGLKGLSGISSDLRTLEASDSPDADFAIDFLTYRINAEIGALTAILGGVDVLVFTGGIGEHSSRIRLGVCSRLSRWLPLSIDEKANAEQAVMLSDALSEILILRLESNENQWMAEQATALLSSCISP